MCGTAARPDPMLMSCLVTSSVAVPAVKPLNCPGPWPRLTPRQSARMGTTTRSNCCPRLVAAAAADPEPYAGRSAGAGLPVAVSGPSPHARGAPAGCGKTRDQRGTIPACAGSIRFGVSDRSVRQDHPRMRGEHALGNGSGCRAGGPWTIPACAGSTLNDLQLYQSGKPISFTSHNREQRLNGPGWRGESKARRCPSTAVPVACDQE